MSRRAALAVSLIVLLVPKPLDAQATALRRTEVTNDLLDLRATGRGFFNLVLDSVPNGRVVRTFLETPRPSNAPSLEILEAVARDVRRADPLAFGGGTGPFANILLSAGGGSAAAAASLPAAALVLRASAEFLAGRVKDELAIEYVDLLLELVNEPVVDDLTTHSRRALALVGETGYRSVLPLLRESVIRDFRSMPARLTTETTFADAAWQPDRAALSLAAVGVRITSEIFESTPVLDVLIGLQDLRPLSQAAVSPDSGFLADDHARHALIIAGALAREYKLHRSDADSILDRHPASGVYFAAFVASDLLRDRARFPGITDPAGVADAVFAGPRVLRDAVDEMTELQQMIERAREAATNGDVVGSYLRAIDRVVRLIAMPGELLPDADLSRLRQLRDAMTRLADAYAAWANRNYTAMLVEVVTIPDVLDVVLLDPNARRYLLFAASFADAGTTEEMVAVIESAAMPPGGYRAKRESAALGLAAYGGGAAYSERIEGGTRALAGGLSFPIGVEFSFPWRPNVGRLSWDTSISLLLTAVDVGNIISLRDDQGTPDPTLEQVLAPGFGIQVGFGADNPWSIGFLAQRVPNLREHEDAKEDVVRYGLFLGIDMPLLRLWSR